MESRPSDGPPRLQRSARPLDTGRILATAKVPSRSAANAMDGQMSSRTLKLAARHMTSRNKCASCRLGALGQRANDCREHAQIIWFCARAALAAHDVHRGGPQDSRRRWLAVSVAQVLA